MKIIKKSFRQCRRKPQSSFHGKSGQFRKKPRRDYKKRLNANRRPNLRPPCDGSVCAFPLKRILIGKKMPIFKNKLNKYMQKAKKTSFASLQNGASIEYPIRAEPRHNMKITANPVKTLNRVFACHGNFYVARSGVIEKQPFVHAKQKGNTAQRLTAEEAAQRIAMCFGNSLAVLAD